MKLSDFDFDLPEELIATRPVKPRPAAPGSDRIHAHARAFTFHDVEGDDIAEEVDLRGFIKTDRT